MHIRWQKHTWHWHQSCLFQKNCDNPQYCITTVDCHSFFETDVIYPRLLDGIDMFKKRLFPWFSHQHKSVKLFKIKTVIHFFGSLKFVCGINTDLYKYASLQIRTFFNVTALVIILILNFQYFCPPFPPFL